MAQLEHIYTFAKTKDIDEYIKHYRKAGFVVGPKAVRHPLGKRNRFIYIGLEYLELESIEDEVAYREGKAPYHDLFRNYPAPYGYGFEEPNIDRFHASLKRRGIQVPDLYSRGPADAKKGGAPWWTFQELPAKLLPGVLPFALRYEKRDYKKVREAYRGPNRIFAISGTTFVSSTPKKDAKAWQQVLAPRTALRKSSSKTSLCVGPHEFEWMTSADFKRGYGQAPQIPPSDKFTSLRKTALVHLLSDNLSVSANMLQRAGWSVASVKVNGKRCLYVAALPSDGFSFFVHTSSPDVWKKERARLGQRCELVSKRDK